MKTDLYNKVTDQIVASLEQGVRPWMKPWSAEHAAGRITRPLRANGIPYQGINVLVLWSDAVVKGYSAPIWMSFRQALELNAHVRKGERGSTVVYASKITRTGTDAETSRAAEGDAGNRFPNALSANLAAFRQGLSETGYVDGQNITIEYRWAQGHYVRLPGLAAELVARKIGVMVTYGASAIAAAKRATATIPIVFFGGGDPVATGVVASLARPGGNLTGVSIMAPELNPKRLDVLSELVPQAGVIALLVNPNNLSAERTIHDLEEAARAKGVQLPILKARLEGDFSNAFAALVQLHVGALVVGSDAYFFSRREQLVGLAAQHAVPAIYDAREFVVSGGLASYGSSFTSSWPQVGIYAGQILKGADPADLPVHQPTKFELVINLKTANALGLTVPPLILARADEVIE